MRGVHMWDEQPGPNLRGSGQVPLSGVVFRTSEGRSAFDLRCLGGFRRVTPQCCCGSVSSPTQVLQSSTTTSLLRVKYCCSLSPPFAVVSAIKSRWKKKWSTLPVARV